MKVGLVLDDTLDKPDGVQQYVIILGRWLAAHGHEVHYLVADTKRADLPNVHSLGRFVSLRFNGNNVRTPLPANRWIIQKLLDELKLDIIHVQMPYSPWLGQLVIQAAPATTKVVGTFHILPAARWHRFTNYALRLCLLPTLGQFRHVTAVSEPAARFARRAYGLKQVSVVPNPVELAKFAATPKPPADGRLSVVYVGRLVWRKGAAQLIRAFQVLPPEVADRARLTICGAGPLERQLRQLAASHPAITFTGFVSEADKCRHLAGADLAVFPALSGESFGIVLTEAMAAGAGVVLGGNNPGYASVLGGQPETLIEPNDTAGFAARLTHFLTDTAKRNELHALQQQLVKRYDIETVGPQVLALYQA